MLYELPALGKRGPSFSYERAEVPCLLQTHIHFCHPPLSITLVCLFGDSLRAEFQVEGKKKLGS